MNRSTGGRTEPIYARLGLDYAANDEGDEEEHWQLLRDSHHERIDPSYWHSIGRGDVYVDAMINFQNDLEMWTVYLYHCRAKGMDFPMELRPTDDDNVPLPIILRYDKKLLSRWKMLLHAMIGSKGCQSLEITNVELPQNLIDELGNALQSMSKFRAGEDDVVSVSFDNNNFDRDCELWKLLDEGCCVTDFSVTNNALDSPKMGTQLAKAIANSKCLRKIDLSGSGIGRNTRLLSTILSSCAKLTKLQLNNISIRQRGVPILSEFLASNPKLKELELKSNDLGDNAANLMAETLRTNTNLRRLSLEGNDFSQVGIDAFSNAILDDTNMDAVVESNHTCRVTGVSNTLQNMQCVKREKIFRAISSNESNATVHQHFLADIPLEIMPEVLHLMQKVPGHVYLLLSLVFDTLRSWKLPLLFWGRHKPEEVKACLGDLISVVANEDDCSKSFHEASLPPRTASEYDVIIPKTSYPLHLCVKEIAFIKESLFMTMFHGYRRRDSEKGPAGLCSPCIERGDVVVSVNRTCMARKSLWEVADLLKASQNFAHVRFERKDSFFRLPINALQTKYDEAYSTSIDLQEKKNLASTKHSDTIEKHRNEAAHITQVAERQFDLAKAKWEEHQKLQDQTQPDKNGHEKALIRSVCVDVLQEVKDRVMIRVTTAVDTLVEQLNDTIRDVTYLVLEDMMNSVERRHSAILCQHSHFIPPIVPTVHNTIVDKDTGETVAAMHTRIESQTAEEIIQAVAQFQRAERKRGHAWVEYNQICKFLGVEKRQRTS